MKLLRFLDSLFAAALLTSIIFVPALVLHNLLGAVGILVGVVFSILSLIALAEA